MSESAAAGHDIQEPTEQDLIDQFVEWVEAMIHDVESVPDNENTRYWCPRWWDHPEAVARLRALYEEYIRAASENTLSAWYIYHWDGHAKALFGPTGPFELCRTTHSFFERAEAYTPRMATEAVPENWEP